VLPLQSWINEKLKFQKAFKKRKNVLRGQRCYGSDVLVVNCIVIISEMTFSESNIGH